MADGDDLRERCEMYRRQLGGVNAASNRKSQQIRELRRANSRLEQVRETHMRRIGRLEALVRDMREEIAARDGGGSDVACMAFDERMEELGIRRIA